MTAALTPEQLLTMLQTCLQRLDSLDQQSEQLTASIEKAANKLATIRKEASEKA